jgi:phage terminase large subunit-like protein
VLYIHTTFLDNIDNLDESFLREAETCKKYDPVKYARDFEGKWLDSDSKALLTKELLDLSISKDDLTNFDKVVVAIDPAVSVNSNSDNTRNSSMREER